MVQLTRARNGDRRQLTNPLLEVLAVDGEEYKGHVIDYVNMFISIYMIDKAGYQSIHEVPKFSIKELIGELGKLSKKERDALNKFFGIEGNRHYLKELKSNDVALQNMIIQASEAAAKLRTAEKMYFYNKRFRDAINQTAAKVHDPEGKYTPLEKAKFAHLYFWFIKDFQYMPYDTSRKTDVMEPIEFETEETQFPAIESYVAEWDNFFSKIPDGDIVISQIIEFIWESDPDLDEMMVEFAELEGVNGIKGEHDPFDGKAKKTMCAAIRKAKERLFANGPWNGDYMRLSEFAKMPKERVEALIEAYNAYKVKYEYDPSNCKKSLRLRTFMRTQGYKTVKVPRYSDRRNFVDEYEMIFFLDMIEYIEKYAPQFSFHGSSFLSYDFGKAIA